MKRRIQRPRERCGRARARSARRRARRSPARSTVNRNVCQIASTKIGSFELGAGSSPSPTQLAAERAGGRVGEAEVDREHERRADERADEEHRRRDQERRKEASALRRGTGASARRLPPGPRPLPSLGANCNQIARIADHRGRDRARAADEGLRRRDARRARARPRGRGRRVRRLRRPVRLRQDDALRMVAGLEDITVGDGPRRREGGQRPAAEGARHGDDLPELRPLPAHERLRQHGVRAEDARHRPRARSGGGSSRRPRSSGSPTCSRSGRGTSRAASASVSRWAARSCASRWRS